MKKMRSLTITFVYAAILAGCGGTSSDTTSTMPATTLAMSTMSMLAAPVATGAEGWWHGASSTGIKMTGLVLDDGTFWFMYNNPNDGEALAGTVQGQGSLNNGVFKATNALDFNLDGLELDATEVSASFTPQQTFNGSIAYPQMGNQKVLFSASYDSNYEQTPQLATIAGSYVGTAAEIDGPDMGTLTIGASGSFNFSGASACSVSGIFLPRAKGNVYTMSVSFGGAPCAQPNLKTTGVGFFDPATKRFYALSVNTNRSSGFNFMGIKQ